MKKTIVSMAAAIALLLNLASCTISMNGDAKPAETPKAAETKTDNGAAAAKPSEAAKTESKPAAPDKTECLKASMPGKKLIADQTFVFDFAPFDKSCFVTFANKEDMVDDKDVPRGSTFHIFRDGKKVYDFPDAFGGMSACWVEGVAFDDLNGDGKTDVVVAGSCLGAKDSYPMNAVFVNTGSKFETDDDKNQQLENFKKISEIKDYVRKNKDKFF
ncbi:MAG: hypothetical protein JSS81_27100 [Acidobacteria bacterium]|nr:hypothetical protein [Acidobacteriota bacterium]